MVATSYIKADQNDGENQIPNKAVLLTTFLTVAAFLLMSSDSISTAVWYCSRFWKASGDFWQTLWDNILDTVGEDPFTLWVYGTVVIVASVYLIMGTVFTIMDVTNKPAALRKYKIQPGTNEPLELSRLPKMLALVGINLTIVNFTMAYFIYLCMEWRGSPPIRTLPTFHWMVVEFAVYLALNEIAFYYVHRILHHNFLYKYIHKLHHEWTAPIAVTVFYAHPIEHIVSNLLPNFVGMFLMGSHVFSAYVYCACALRTTMLVHCGYSFPYFRFVEFHDYHHMKFNKNFGTLGVLDLLHGTYADVTQGLNHVRFLRMLIPKKMLKNSSPKCKSQ